MDAAGGMRDQPRRGPHVLDGHVKYFECDLFAQRISQQTADDLAGVHGQDRREIELSGEIGEDQSQRPGRQRTARWAVRLRAMLRKLRFLALVRERI